jgi:hypothetical protein
LRQHLAALSIVGALMVCLPVVQVLRFQSEQIEALVRHRESLNPMLRAVQVQRGVLAHRDLSAQVLRGRSALEAARQQHQQELEQRMQLLVTDLDFMHLGLALREAQTLHDDFVSLATQVTERRISAPDSDAGHRLLVEQTLQVMDLAQDLGDGVTAGWQDAETRFALTLTRELPRAAWQLGQAGGAVEVAAAQAQRLQHLIERHGWAVRQPWAPTTTASSAMAQASHAASASLQAWTALALTADVQDTAADSARANALVAQWQLFDLAHATASQSLAEQVATAQRQRLQSLAGLLALALAAAGLLVRLWMLSTTPIAAPSTTPNAPPTSPQAAADDGPDNSERPLSGAHSEAQVLLQRLRWAEAALQTTARSRAAALPPNDSA